MAAVKRADRIIFVALALIAASLGCGPSEPVGGLALGVALTDLTDTIDSQIRDAVDAGDFFIEKSGRTARMTVKAMLLDSEDDLERAVEDLDNATQNALLTLRQEVARLEDLPSQVVDLEELTYLDTQNLVNRVLPDAMTVTSLRGFSQAYRPENAPYTFKVFGNPFQIGNDYRFSAEVGGFSPTNISVRRANVLEFSIPNEALRAHHLEHEVARVSVALKVDRRQKAWLFGRESWKTIYEYDDPQGILLWPKFPIQAEAYEVYGVPAVDTDRVETLTTTKRMAASGRSCRNSDHSCDRSCVRCSTMCITLPDGAALISASPRRVSSDSDASTRNLRVRDRNVCARTKNWSEGHAAEFTYTVTFHPRTTNPEKRPVVVDPLDETSAVLAEEASRGWLRFGTDYQVVFDHRRFQSYDLRLRFFNGDGIVLTKGGVDPRVKMTPEFGAPAFKRLSFRVEPWAGAS